MSIALKTYLFGSSKPHYRGSVIELLGKNAIDIFEKYQVWVEFGTYYIAIGGFDGISFGFDEEFIITWVSFGRSFDGKEIIAKASDYARINHLGIKVTRHGNMHGIYYSVRLIDKYIVTPYLGVENSSTFDREKKQQLFML